jgi:hypothetical protein
VREFNDFYYLCSKCSRPMGYSAGVRWRAPQLAIEPHDGGVLVEEALIVSCLHCGWWYEMKTRDMEKETAPAE